LQAAFALAQGEHDVAFLRTKSTNNSTLKRYNTYERSCGKHKMPKLAHLSQRFSHPLVQFLAFLPFLPSLGVVLKSPWEDSGPVVFLSEGGDRSDSFSPWTEETPMVPDLSSLTNFFSAPVRPLPVDPLSDERCCPPLFVSAIPPLPSSVSPLPLSVVSLPLLASSVPPPVSFSLLPLPLFLLSTLPVVAPLPPGVLPWPLVFFFQVPAHTFHHRNLTSKQS